MRGASSARARLPVNYRIDARAVMEPEVVFLASERARIAHHEAGHAVIAVVQGLGLRHARIAPEPEVLTNAALNGVAWPCVEERARFYCGGFCADRHYSPSCASRANSEHDLREALHLLDCSAARLACAIHETDRLIVAHWRAVEAVATALLERESLTAMELHRIIIAAR